jgi:chemotaxis protein CheX
MADSVDIDPQVREQLIEPFITAIGEALRDMAGIEIVPAACSRTKRAKAPYDIAVLLRLHSAMLGGLVLSAADSSAQELARRMLPDAKDLDDTLVRDCVGEIANITAGQAKALLHGSPYHFTFSTPMPFSGMENELAVENGECLQLDLQSDAGPFALQIWVKAGVLA